MRERSVKWWEEKCKDEKKERGVNRGVREGGVKEGERKEGVG